MGCFLTSVLAIYFFFNIFPQGRTTEKINKWDYMKQKTFCTMKEIINKVKSLPTEWENIFANNMSDTA